MSSQRPNVLWLMTDEQRTDSLGCYGSSWAQTPHLDAVAARGACFEAAMTPSPVCVPARVSLLGGHRPSETGVLSNVDHSAHWQPLTHVFRDHGYRTATFGKQHYLPRGAFETEVDEVLSDAVDYFAYADDYNEDDWQVVKYPSEQRGWLFGGRFPDSTQNTAEARVVAAARQWLEAHDPRTPFFLRLSFNSPHTPVVPPAPFDTVLDTADIAVPGAFDAPLGDVPAWEADFLRDFQGSHRLTEAQLERAHQCYYGLVSFVDAQFGAILEWMDRRRMLENTIIAFCSDHGTHLGDHGMMQKQTFYEPVVRVPFFITAPRSTAVPCRVSTPVGTRSLLPTLLDLCGLEPPEALERLNLADTVRTGAEPEARAVVSELTQATWGYRPNDRLMMVRRGRWKLSSFYDGPGTDPLSEWADASLYDLHSDPWETRNLIRQPGHARIAKGLLRRATTQ